MKYLICLLTLLLFATSYGHGQELELGSKIVESAEIQNLEKDKPYHVKITNFIFRKVDHRRRIVEFTADDADKITTYIMRQGGVLSCKSNSIDKSFKVITKSEINGKDPFDHKHIVRELSKVGYVAITSRAYKDVVLFASRANCAHRNVIDGVVITTRDKMIVDDCNDCSQVKVSKEVENKYKEMDYGGDEMDFGFDDAGSEEEAKVSTPVVNKITTPAPKSEKNQGSVEYIEVKANSKNMDNGVEKELENMDEEELEYQNPTLNMAPR